MPFHILRQPIAVIGAGAWGSALTLLLARNGNNVRLWDRQEALLESIHLHRENQRYLPGFTFQDNVHVAMTLPELLEGVKDILIVVPSHAFREVLQTIHPLIDQPRIVWGTKGLDPSTKCFLHEVVFEIYSDSTPIAVLSGPSFSKEVAADKPTAVSIAGNNQNFIDDLITRLHNINFRLYQNSDMIGLQIYGVVKNVLAIAVGIAEGLHLGANTRAALITRGLVEMGRLGEALGADPHTLMSLAGVGDVILTCTDDQSRNRRFGKAIANNESVERAEKQITQSVEGLHNVRQLCELAKEYSIEMPITQQVYRILFESLSPKEAVEDLLSRPPQPES